MPAEPNLTLTVPPEILTRLDELAAQTAQSPAALAVHALTAFVENEQRIRQSIRAGIGDIEAGRYVSGEKVDAWLASWGDDNELPAPK